MRKFLNDPRAVVREMLEGLCDLSPGLALLAEDGVILRNPWPPLRRAARGRGDLGRRRGA